MFFSVITENWNWKTLTKNLVSFKNGTGLRMKNFNIMGVHWNIRLLGEGSHTKAIYKVENCLKREGGGWYPNAHYQLTLELLKAIATLSNVFKVYNSNSWTRDQFFGMGPLSECLYQIFKYYQKTNSPIVKQNHHSK